MGSQAALSNDRSRMHWTPIMERYFVDLMLEQLHRGNRVGYSFNKQAWADIHTMFNAKFGSHYDKEGLKSRYANLWKQFNDVRNLLSHNGFSWDAARQMVTADGFSWDAYIKVHPDAQCYRTKPVLNFDDLCVVYASTIADGRYSLSSHDASLDDVQKLHLGDGRKYAERRNISNRNEIGSTASNNEHPKTYWTAAMDQFFIELLLDQLGRGNKVNNAFNRKAWRNMLAMFSTKFGPQHSKRVLRHRYSKLSKYYSDITVLLKEGFSWDEKLQMLVADDDVWDTYVKAHPHARAYRTKILPNYHDLELIFREGSDDVTSNLHQEKNLEDVVSEINVGDGDGSGNHNPIGTDRTRTYWTSPMDRCFIDLLLEQVKKAKKLGLTFGTHAWSEMSTSFNKRFNSHYDKDVLKSRYKHLRRLFKDVYKLLQQSGFSWDDTREMVAAEDNVWDSYTKVHPEARLLRIKTLPGYRKLCVIFAEECSDTRGYLAHVAVPSGESPTFITGQEKNGSFPSVYDAASAIEWTESMECCFIDLMIEEVNQGNKIRNRFNEQAWTHMIEVFSAKLGLQCDKQFLEDQYFCLMKRHDDIRNLLNHHGFAWDETLQMIIAENDVWEAYIKDHQEAISYRNKFLDSYPDLCRIFGNEVSDASVSAPGQLHWMEANDITIEMDMDGTCGNLVVTNNTEILDQDNERLVEMDGTSGTAAAEMSGEDIERPGEINTGKRTGKKSSNSKHLNKKPKIDRRMNEALSDRSFENALTALQAMPDVDEELVMDACDLLEDERKARIFLALDISLRKKWLLRKLRSQ
ncbi:L10-interacting MYB domain-containing protein [Senna tora]|uniref:L10-interacting MYB domain-containing protein n=1 Tax=Senna tora TaxID=362788 RepID=A0A834TZH4_9FABA|nr:L10-interacting MYB domain-containing protein [Senna tora]